MFAAIGEIKGTSVYSFMFVEGTYNWILIKPQIKLHPNKANFETDVKVTVGKFDYTTKVNGIVELQEKSGQIISDIKLHFLS